MKKIVLFATMFLFAIGCSQYDDERILQDLDDIDGMLTGMEDDVNSLESQMTSLTALLNSVYITTISTDANGRYVITYMNADGFTSTLTVATQSDVVTLPIIGIAKDDSDGQWYWRQTADNGETWNWIYKEDGVSRYIVGGEMPEVSINADGYWTVNGEPLIGSDGEPVLANDASNILFSEVYVDEDAGAAVFVLADGTTFSIQMFEALSIEFDVPIYNSIADASTKLKIRYTVSGTLADEAIVDVFTAYNVVAEIDRETSTITVSMDSGAEEGNILVAAYANGSSVLKPLFFTFGTAEIQEPLYNGSNAIIELEGDFTTIDITVSANIDYAVSIEETAQSWISLLSTKAMTTTTYEFAVDSYEDASGATRSGEIVFANNLYDLSASITVLQYPNAPEANESGIASATDLVQFASAVNSGMSTSRWQNDDGAVVLLNDIDMSEVSGWTPIGTADGSTYSTSDPFSTKNPFTGVFDGQGFAIKGLDCSREVNSATGIAFFGAISSATVRNLVLGDPDEDITWTFTGTGPMGTGIAAFCVYAVNSTVENVTNYYNISFEGNLSSNGPQMFGGLFATIKNSTIGGSSKSLGCVNYGDVAVGVNSNTGNGATGVQTAGVCALMANVSGNVLNHCMNYGHISCPAGREGGIVGTMHDGKITNCENFGFIEDNVAGQTGLTYDSKRMGGIVGGTSDLTTVLTAEVSSCTNHGNVFSHLGCRTGGLIGHSNVQIIGCTNEGVILSDHTVSGQGSGWCCGFSGASTSSWTNVQGCTPGGKVGDYSEYKDNPDAAPDASNDNAFAYMNSRYDPTINN